MPRGASIRFLKKKIGAVPAKAACFLPICLFAFLAPVHKPVLYIIGDSTVRNGDGTGINGLWGWGDCIAPFFDTSRISVENHAVGGRSSRTFITEGKWQRILDRLQPGDYVLMQFGHNDGGPLDDTARARGSLKGIGNDSVEIYNPIRKMRETVYSYGAYMRKYAEDTKLHKAIPIICSPIPRRIFRNGKCERSDNSYGGWARQVALSTGAFFVDLNNRIANRYDSMGEQVAKSFFPGDHTHTNRAGAQLNAIILVEGIRELKNCSLKSYLKK